MNHCELNKTHEKTFLNAGSHGAHVSGLSSNCHHAKRVARYGGELSRTDAHNATPFPTSFTVGTRSAVDNQGVLSCWL